MDTFHIAQEDQNDRVAVVSSRLLRECIRLRIFPSYGVGGWLSFWLFLLIQGNYELCARRKIIFFSEDPAIAESCVFFTLFLVSITTLNLTTRSSQNQVNEDYLN